MTGYNNCINYIVEAKKQGLGSRKIAKDLGVSKTTVNYWYQRFLDEQNESAVDILNIQQSHKLKGPKVLILDIENSPTLGYVWGLWKQNVGLNQIKEEWHLLSFAAKWLGDSEDKVIYMDQRNEPNIEDDSAMLQKLWDLLEEADWLITQNGRQFDIKKIRARMIMQGFKPFSPVRHIDTLEIAKRVFGFTSNKLEWMTDKLCTKYKKSKHQKFTGFELWAECLKGNIEAFQEMEDYNKLDILSLEELYYKVSPWYDKLPNPNLYTESVDIQCICGSHNIVEQGFATTDVSKFQQYVCKDCGKIYRGRVNLLSKDKKQSILTNVREN